MRGTVSDRTCLEPTTLAEACAWLRDEPGLTPLAGCTDLFVALNFGQLELRRFLNLWRLDELRGIALSGRRLRIGALTTYAEILRSDLVQERLPILVEAAATIGGLQIQSRGTIGGNLANASPAGDTPPVLAVADADVIAVSADGERRIPMAEFFTGYRQTALRGDELIAAVEIPPVEGVQRFRKVGTRAANAISKVVLAAVLGDRPRLAAGSVAPTVIRLHEAEAALAAAAGPEDVRAAVLRDIQPIDDLRSTAAYRRAVTANLVARLVQGSGVE